MALYAGKSVDPLITSSCHCSSIISRRWTRLHRLRHMIRRNHLAARQISNRPRQLQYPTIRPGRQVQLLHCHLQ